jgi:hypothetical protein
MVLSPLQSVRDGPMIAQYTGHDDEVAVAAQQSDLILGWFCATLSHTVTVRQTFVV